MPEKTYTVSQFAKLIGKSIKTLQRWDREGTLKAKRTITSRRYYTDEDLLNINGVNLNKIESDVDLVIESINKLLLVLNNLYHIKGNLEKNNGKN